MFLQNLVFRAFVYNKGLFKNLGVVVKSIKFLIIPAQYFLEQNFTGKDGSFSFLFLTVDEFPDAFNESRLEFPIDLKSMPEICKGKDA